MHARITSETIRTLIGLTTLLLAAHSGFAQTRYATGDVVENATLIERGTGQPVSLSSLEGKVVFIEWFAWWCPFCQSAAAQIKPGIDDYYAARGHANANGVPVVHVMANLQSNQEEQTQSFLNSYGLGSLLVIEDFQRAFANRFQSGGQPIFAIINGVAGSPSHRQWELVFSQLGYGQTQFPVQDFRSAIDSVQPGSAAPSISAHPQSQAAAPGGSVTFSVSATGNPPPSVQWQRNGSAVSGATGATLAIAAAQLGDAGIYSASVTNGGEAVVSRGAILGLTTTAKVTGAGEEVGSDIFVAANGNTFDQVLLHGPAAAITADATLNQITRVSYIDLSDDIVQVEFSGPGTLSLILENPTGPAAPANYNQAVSYMKGHAGIVIVGATEHTNVSVFSVGRITAVNQSLFKSEIGYDGIADIGFIAISSANGKFGGVRTANAHYVGTKGLTGIYAPNVQFDGPVFIGDITAADSATPSMILGSANDTRIAGGDLEQGSGRAVQVSGVTQLRFVAGQDSHGNSIAAKNNRAILEQDGQNVTAQVVVNPAP